MAEQFLTLMADLDDEAQKAMGEWYEQLRLAEFHGTQTPGLPFHISIHTFSLDKEQEIMEEMEKLSKDFAPIPIHISHIGIFGEGKVLFGAPDMNAAYLAKFREAIKTESIDPNPWTPHATIMIDEPETICAAIPVLLKSFKPFEAKITKLHLCAFWPTREILSVEFCGRK